jgi:hypothetical protein
MDACYYVSTKLGYIWILVQIWIELFESIHDLNYQNSSVSKKMFLRQG